MTTATANAGREPIPWESRIRRESDGRWGTVTLSGNGRDRIQIKWDKAVVPEPHWYTSEELHDGPFRVCLPVEHCSGCGAIVDDEDVDDGYTDCCNEGACGPCALVDGVYMCGTVPESESS